MLPRRSDLIRCPSLGPCSGNRPVTQNYLQLLRALALGWLLAARQTRNILKVAISGLYEPEARRHNFFEFQEFMYVGQLPMISATSYLCSWSPPLSLIHTRLFVLYSLVTVVPSPWPPATGQTSTSPTASHSPTTRPNPTPNSPPPPPRSSTP
jgi:hypothetical protein